MLHAGTLNARAFFRGGGAIKSMNWNHGSLGFHEKSESRSV